ncbi:MAG TPA: hypothetical protein VHD87_15310 [Acidimicrobiales bacterium]|nr:hypothetical protein [Acidimicrobiales bacterium]
MTYIPITPTEMRTVAESRSIDELRDALTRGARTLDDAEQEIADLHRALESARADATPMEVRQHPKAEAATEDSIAAFLATIDPVKLDETVQAAIAEAIVEATLAARNIRDEAKRRVEALAEAVLADVAELSSTVHAARGSVTAMSQLETNLHSWEGKFGTRVRTLVDQLDLPWTEKVSAIAKLLTRHAVASPLDQP